MSRHDVVRVLVIPQGCTRDNTGRMLGDDWLLATLGFSGFSADADVYLTTDRLHGDEIPSDLNDARDCAALIARLLNEHYQGRS